MAIVSEPGKKYQRELKQVLATQVKRYGPYTALYDRLRLLYGPYYRRNIGRRNTGRKVTVYGPYYCARDYGAIRPIYDRKLSVLFIV
jgi:hypothetical protein